MGRDQRQRGIERKVIKSQSKSDVGVLDPQLLGDLLLKRTKKFNPELSLVESEEHRVPGEA